MGLSKKYLILVGDGMGDYPIKELDGKTPLEAAHTPYMDVLAGCAEMGTVKTVPQGMEPGSDVANMSILGYDPRVCHTGRGPLEAGGMGVRLEKGDVAFRCNLVTIESKDGTRIMADYSAGHIKTEEARKIIAALRECLEGLPLELYAGVSYRHLLVWKGGPAGLKTTPPHDIIGQPVEKYEEVYESTPVLKTLRDRAREVLRSHGVNAERIARGEKPVTDLWPWGQGTTPIMKSLKERCGLSGMVISAVDLIKGIGFYAGFETPEVKGATGYLDTNYEEKVRLALEGLNRLDCVYVHIEAPDETSHEGDLKKKLIAIEDFDRRVVGPILQGIGFSGSVDLLVITDHYTPLSVRTHVSEPVPFMIVRNVDKINLSNIGGHGIGTKFCEKNAQKGALHFESGVELFSYFIGNC